MLFHLAQLSSIPHLLFRKEWEQRKQRAEQLGPGKYRHTDFVEQLARKPGSSRGVCQSRGARFPKENKVRGEEEEEEEEEDAYLSSCVHSSTVTCLALGHMEREECRGQRRKGEQVSLRAQLVSWRLEDPTFEPCQPQAATWAPGSTDIQPLWKRCWQRGQVQGDHMTCSLERDTRRLNHK